MKAKNWFGLTALALSGCFTVSQSDFPETQLTPCPQAGATVAVSGFEAYVTTYTSIYSYSTVWASTPGYRHGHHYHRGWIYPETVPTTTYIPQRQMTPEFVIKAQESLENAGYIVSPTNASYVVDVRFSGPVTTDGELAAECATMVLTLLTTDYTRATWSAHLKITEAASGRVVFSQDYTQPYSACVWSPIPLFGPLGARDVQSEYIQGWSLAALTDRAIADATAFLATVVQAGK